MPLAQHIRRPFDSSMRPRGHMEPSLLTGTACPPASAPHVQAGTSSLPYRSLAGAPGPAGSLAGGGRARAWRWRLHEPSTTATTRWAGGRVCAAQLGPQGARPGGMASLPHVLQPAHCRPALATTHTQGYVHGDIKSSNVLLCGSGTAKLADVAFSRRIEPPPPELETCDSVTFEPPPLSGTFAWCV